MLFAGGVIRGKKLQRGSVLTFLDVQGKQRTSRDNPQAHMSQEELSELYQSVYLFKWLVKEEDYLLQQKPATDQAKAKYWSMFEQLNEDEYDFEDFGDDHSSPESQREVEDYISDQEQEEEKPKAEGMKLNFSKPQTG